MFGEFLISFDERNMCGCKTLAMRGRNLKSKNASADTLFRDDYEQVYSIKDSNKINLYKSV